MTSKFMIFHGLMYLSAEKECDFTQKPAKGFTKKISGRPGRTALRDDRFRLYRRFGLQDGMAGGYS
jgi:hypothetical protein